SRRTPPDACTAAVRAPPRRGPRRPRPPLHLVVALDVSGSMDGPPIEYVKAGLVEMIPSLMPADRRWLVTDSGSAQVVIEAVPADQTATLESAFKGIVADGPTNLFDG